MISKDLIVTKHEPKTTTKGAYAKYMSCRLKSLGSRVVSID